MKATTGHRGWRTGRRQRRRTARHGCRGPWTTAAGASRRRQRTARRGPRPAGQGATHRGEDGSAPAVLRRCRGFLELPLAPATQRPSSTSPLPGGAVLRCVATTSRCRWRFFLIHIIIFAEYQHKHSANPNDALQFRLHRFPVNSLFFAEWAIKHSANSLPCISTKSTRRRFFAEANFAECVSPSATLGEGFAELDSGLRRVF